MLLDITLSDLVASCCDNLVYAILFNKSQQALKDNGLGTLVFSAYTSITHPAFAIVLAEHAQRFKYYFKELDNSLLSLPDNPRGECYQVEFWLKPVVGTFDRAVDTLRETRRIIVSSKTIVNAALSATGVAELANVQAHLSAVYDSENLLLRFMSHLDSNGELITNPISVNLTVTDNAGATIINVVDSVYITNQPGVFYIEVPNTNLPNDQIFIAKAAITDANGLVHNTISYLNTWD